MAYKEVKEHLEHHDWPLPFYLFLIFLILIACLLAAFEIQLAYNVFSESKPGAVETLIVILSLIAIGVMFVVFSLLIAHLKFINEILAFFRPIYKKFSFVLFACSIFVFWAFGAMYYAGHDTKSYPVVLSAEFESENSTIYSWCYPINKGFVEGDYLECTLVSNKVIYSIDNPSARHIINDKDFSRIFPYNIRNFQVLDKTSTQNSADLKSLISLSKPGHYGIELLFNYTMEENITKEAHLFGEFDVISKQEAEERQLNLWGITLAIFAFPVTILPSVFNSIGDMIKN